MAFTPLTLNDIELVRPFLKRLCAQTCDFTVGGMFMWRDYFRMEYAVEDDVFYSRLYNSDDELYYNIPVSGDIPSSIIRLVESNELPIRFCTVPEPFLKYFEQLKNRIAFTEQDDYADYLYNAEELAGLSGKRYHGQRSLVNQFLRKHEDWHFDQIGADDVARVRDFFCNTYLPASSEGDTGTEENKKVLEVLDNFELYGFIGGVLSVDDTIVGFSLNEVMGSTLFTHVEKADRSFKGAYQVLVKQTASCFAKEPIRFVNREEDMGEPGLRTSKESYHPICRLKKFIVEVFC